ncbi:hypothetical protein HCN52_06820 [Streptomyces bohaiensis]|uniref:Uncharacterized protein n=1 Tax=Streptomyces bohaiensis TaxID=1431344 RepID=A0ABX1C9U2_9ACTN|nr:hypothetical protein [Streptomyces bohaiensis]
MCLERDHSCTEQAGEPGGSADLGAGSPSPEALASLQALRRMAVELRRSIDTHFEELDRQ